MRLELAINFDQYQPTDLGSCGEPYTVLAACALSVGQLAHGYFGLGLAGQQRPPEPWNDSHGLEYGARLEFRWDRFSFAITDFYGFQDFPYVETLFSYSRNVDPVSGRLRHTMTTGSCRTGKEPACLDADKALTEHSANQQLFAMVCANTVGIAPALDPTACFANVFGSPNRTMPEGVTAPARGGGPQHPRPGRHRRRDSGKPDPAGPRRVPGRPQRAERHRPLHLRRARAR